jgi:phosphoribosylformylglycinamidine synthase II
MTLAEVEVTLTKEEVEYGRRYLRREPNGLEWMMIDAEWSEHCSYKSSKPYLKLLPTKGKRVILGPGYDSGVVDIGNGYVATAHIESHNHPSAIDPYGGAATGIGGVVRDILCMGTRPIAFLDSLRFGRIDESLHSRWLFKNVVRGIADYGNCIGVPTVAGEVEFDESFEKNCLVDVMALGVGKRADIVLAKASKPGDSVILVGGSTGRDGIHGVTFASRVLTDKSEDDRSAVQIPDPFTKKLIMEATLEATATGYVHGLKDLGGGGLTCGISEMADKGKTGIQVDISKVHLREMGLTPTEIMISESQERMVFIVGKDHEREISDIFEKFEVPYRKIGEVIKQRQIVVMEKGRELARLPTEFLANAPIIWRKLKKPKKRVGEKPKQPKDLAKILMGLLASPNIASKEWVYRQYDHEVGVRTVVKPGQGDAAVLRLPNGKFVAIKADGNSSRCHVDPYTGAADCVAEACRNIVAVGAEPIAMLDHCQFGDPNNPEVFWTFVQTMKGISDTCKKLSLPCIGGKVSFYNEDTETRTAIKPTPVILVFGLINKKKHITTSGFRDGDAIVVVGKTKRDLGGSEYYRFVNASDVTLAPIDLGLEKRILRAMLTSIRLGYVNSCHDVSGGGLGVALAEMCINGGIGAAIDLKGIQHTLKDDELLFSESSGRFVISTKTCSDALKFFTKHRIPATKVGDVRNDRLDIVTRNSRISCTLEEMTRAYSKSIGRLVE